MIMVNTCGQECQIITGRIFDLIAGLFTDI